MKSRIIIGEMKKAQSAVPVLLMIFLGMFIFYVLWAQPTHVVDVLNLSVEEGNETPVTEPEGKEKALFKKEDVGAVGRMTGGTFNDHKIGPISLSYPKVSEEIKNIEDLSLTASVLNSPSYQTQLGAEEGDLTLEFSGSSQKHPLLEVYYNNSQKFSTTLGERENYEVNLGKVKERELRIACKWQSLAVWQTQTCDLDNVSIKREYYDDTGAEEFLSFEVSNAEFKAADNLRVLFEVQGRSGSGELEIRVNNFSVFEGEPSPRNASYSKIVKAKNVGLIAGENTVSFRTEEGTSYSLKDVKLVTYEKEEEEATKSFEFYVPSNVSEKAKTYKLLLNVEDVSIEGTITLEFPFKNYVKTQDEISEGWNSYYIEKKVLRDGRNTLTLRSREGVGGRFIVSDLIFKWIK